MAPSGREPRGGKVLFRNVHQLRCPARLQKGNNQLQGRNFILNPESSAVQGSRFSLIQRTQLCSMKLFTSFFPIRCKFTPTVHLVSAATLRPCNRTHSLLNTRTQVRPYSSRNTHLNKALLSYPLLQPGCEGEGLPRSSGWQIPRDAA